MERRIDSAELSSWLADLLQLTTMTIATTGLDGEPHAAAVYFACDELINLYFFSEAKSQHTLDISDEPRAAIGVHSEGGGWQTIHGMQARGTITSVQSDQDWQTAWDIYQSKFPFVADLEEVITINQLFMFTPHWIRLVDNRRGFGFKKEWGKILTENVGGEVQRWRLLTDDQEISGSRRG